jgi:hypothetical protein
MTSKKYLESIDPERGTTVQECRAAMREELDKFDAMLTNPAYFEDTYPNMDADDAMTLHGCFYLLEPLEEGWGKWGLWKCMCPDFFSGGS